MRNAQIYVFKNGMVAVFDDLGHQVPELQGMLQKKKWLALFEWLKEGPSG